jgi:chorismate mutase-like protein
MSDMTTFRREIDSLDEELIKALARRFDIVREVAAYKSRTGIAVIQPDRIRQIKDRCTDLGGNHGMRPEFLRQLYDLIIAESCFLEHELIQRAKQGSRS